eukprot:COSAG06_NODE_17574_length_933_cov_1.005995_1_plen_304_part_10
MYVASSDVHISFTVFERNQAGAGYTGAALFVSKCALPEVESWAYGVSCHGDLGEGNIDDLIRDYNGHEPRGSVAVLRHTLFRGNWAGFDARPGSSRWDYIQGGAVEVIMDSTMATFFTTFESNKCVHYDKNENGEYGASDDVSRNRDLQGGAIYTKLNSTIRLSATQFVDNQVSTVEQGASAQGAGWGGGAIYAVDYGTTVTVQSTTFRENFAAEGGGIYLTDERQDTHGNHHREAPAILFVMNSAFIGNKATGRNEAFGGYGYGSALFISRAPATLVYTSFIANEGAGGAIYVDRGGSIDTSL